MSRWASKAKRICSRWTSEAGAGSGLLFHLRPVAGGRPESASRPDRRCADDERMGLGLLAVQGALPDAAGIDGRRRRATVSAACRIDGIMQDWQYWKPGSWGSHEFDPARYPDPAGMIRALHSRTPTCSFLFGRGLIWASPTCWNWSRPARFTRRSAERLSQRAGQMVRPVQSRRPAHLLETNVRTSLLRWALTAGGWTPASRNWAGKSGEFRTFKTAAGPGATVYNAYPLMNTSGIYAGQRAETDKKRLVILTRSAYAGQQRNAAITWSGDIRGNWDVFAKQIPAGLNFSLSGIPYWNTDIGGFFGGRPCDPKYQPSCSRAGSSSARSARCSACTAPATARNCGVWTGHAEDSGQLRSSCATACCLTSIPSSWQVTSEGDTMMRPLVMDFRRIPTALNIPDQFLFGPAFMVCPVTQPRRDEPDVYLPAGTALV